MLHVILNPVSGAGRGAIEWKEIRSLFSDIDYEIYRTKYEGHAIEIADELTKTGEELTIIVIGGDGTLNEVVNGINFIEKVTIGYVPVGSGNDFARGMKFSSKPYERMKQILNSNRIVKSDVGYILYDEGSRKTRFNISCGFGWEASICRKANIESVIKKFLNRIGLGKLTYTAIAIGELINYPRYKVTLKSDNGDYEFDNVLFTVGMNLPYEGGGLMFAPTAKCGSGTLQMVVAHDMTYFGVVRVLLKAFKGNHVKHKDKIGIFDCKSVIVEANQKMDIHTDGQPILARGRIEYYVEKEQLKFID